MKTCMLCEHFYMDSGERGYSEWTPGSPRDWGCCEEAMPGPEDSVPAPKSSTMKGQPMSFSLALEINPAQTLIGVAERCPAYSPPEVDNEDARDGTVADHLGDLIESAKRRYLKAAEEDLAESAMRRYKAESSKPEP